MVRTSRSSQGKNIENTRQIIRCAPHSQGLGLDTALQGVTSNVAYKCIESPIVKG